MTIDQIITALYAVALILGLALVWYFRTEIRAAFGRVTKIGPIELSSEQTPSSPTKPVQLGKPVQLSTANVTVASPAGTAMAQTSSSGLPQFIASITALVSQDQLDPVIQANRANILGGKADPPELNEALLYYSAALAVTLAHERNYRGVFGSQLQLLRHMETAVAGIDRATATAIFEAAKAANPDLYRYFTFDHWLAFLQQSSLMETAPNGNYVLTAFGRGLLRYIQSQGLSLVKAF
jgi:hypothetical protein